MGSALDDYLAAEDYVNSLIMGPPSPPPDTPRDVIHERAVARLERLHDFLAFLGNPERRYRTVHVAGTSGKGSTTTFTANILQAAGYRVGTHVSPYLQVATEKLQINGRLIPASRYRRLVDDMRESVEAWVAAGRQRPNYGEFWVAMTLRYFAEERVDIAVIEVGAGGRFDMTNVIEPEVAAITSIGYDHMVTLGSTLPEIAWHKAGIIKAGAVAITTVTEREALPVIEAEAREQGVELLRIGPGEAFADVATDASGTSFTDARSGARFHVNLPGTFQAANAALAAAIVRVIEPGISERTIASGLAASRFPGRMEVIQQDPLVLLDGAHNPEKVASLARNLDLLFPDRKVMLVFGALESKSYGEMFEQLRPRVSRLVATAPKVLAKPAINAAAIAALAREDVPVEAVDDPLQAVERAISLAGRDDLVLVTGSLYLVGNVRERWHPTQRILEQGSLWPQ